MDWLVNNYDTILSIITAVTGAVIATTAFVKSLKSEKRVANQLVSLKNDVTITRGGIVQAFKEAVVTKDVKVSVNGQVRQVIGEEMAKVVNIVQKGEERRTKMMYWTLKIVSWTAAANKLTVEQQSEVAELMAWIAEEEQIIDTL